MSNIRHHQRSLCVWSSPRSQPVKLLSGCVRGESGLPFRSRSANVRRTRISPLASYRARRPFWRFAVRCLAASCNAEPAFVSKPESPSQCWPRPVPKQRRGGVKTRPTNSGPGAISCSSKASATSVRMMVAPDHSIEWTPRSQPRCRPVAAHVSEPYRVLYEHIWERTVAGLVAIHNSPVPTPAPARPAVSR